MSFRQLLKTKRIFIDGAMGTYLQANGLPAGQLPESMNISAPQTIVSIHEAYLKIGCDVITTNTFGANRIKLKNSGLDTEEVVLAALTNAKKAIMNTDRDKKAYIALDVSSTGRLLEPLGDLTFDEAYETFKEQIVFGAKHGADLIIIETMTDTYEMKAAVLAAKENTDLPILASFSFDENGKLLTGGDILAAVALLEGLGVDALGVNCGFGPDKMLEFVEEFMTFASIPVLIMPNAGMPTIVNGETVFSSNPLDFSKTMSEIAKMGAHILGGCCGTTPEHLKQTMVACLGIPYTSPSAKDFTLISSYSKSCLIGPKPLIIGERINPTGKKRLKEALFEEDYDYLVDLGLEQVSSGAHILDVNVGTPGLEEAEVLTKAVKELQTSISLPLQLDSADPLALESSMRIYNGKALVNSVSGKEEDLNTILPLIKKYGGVLVALTLDDNGIPQSAQGRFDIACKIIERAMSFGIDKKDIIIDTLTMTVGAASDAAQVTLDALALVKEKLGVKTVLGISNVSFGLPERDIINATFFAQALYRGLDLAIINPESKAMMNTYFSHMALIGIDSQCLEYSNYVKSLTSEGNLNIEEPVKRPPLFDAIKNGQAQRAYELTVELLTENPPQKLVTEILVPALNDVGDGFEKKTLFLPQLIKSAEAAQSAFKAIKEKLEESGQKQKTKERVLIATVKGDIHDIGKNIAKVMLENYGYEVLDLGSNVDCRLIVDTVKQEKIKLLGLSALMTTTAPLMKDIIQILKREGADCKVMVGGAVITKDYASQIGADFYAADAISGVAIAQEVFENK